MAKFIIHFFLLLLPFLGLGQNRPGTLLWEVSKPGVPHTSYLFGTFHEVNAAFFSTLSNAVAKLDQSEVLYVEEKMSDAKHIAGASQLTFWTRKKWEGTLNPEQEKVFAAFVEKAEDQTYYTYPPLLLTTTLARIYIQNFCDTLSRESGELMDHHIEKMAHSRQQVLSLDRPQLDILAEGVNSRDSTQNMGYVKAVIKLMDVMLKDDATDCEIVQNYTNFQIDYQLNTPIKTASDAYQLHQRNDDWMVLLNKAFREKSCFVAVGYGHLRFKEGLIGQLRNLGYQVKPIHPEIFALVPMGFCYPGTGSSGDLPPRKECASHWHSRLFERMTHLKLIVLIGAYAQNYYLGDAKKGTLTETVKHFDEYLPTYFVLPHPSPRNNIWLKKNPWFEREVLSFLREKVDSLALSGFLRDDGTPNQKFRP